LLIDEQYKKQLIKHLSEFITEDRLALFYDNLKQRTSRVTIALEDIFHSQIQCSAKNSRLSWDTKHPHH